jgi:hypothetical protein
MRRATVIGPASENLHTSGLMQRSEKFVFIRNSSAQD